VLADQTIGTALVLLSWLQGKIVPLARIDSDDAFVWFGMT